MENTQQQNAAVTPLTLSAILAAGIDLSAATIEQITSALFGAPVFTSSVGDVFDTKDPNGTGATWVGRRMATASVPLCILGHEIGINFRCTVYRDLSPNGEDYAVRASLPQGASKYQSAFEGNDQLVAALRYHVADHADRWLAEQAKIARPTAHTATANAQPRLVVRKLAKPAAATTTPSVTTPETLRGMTEAEYNALRARIEAELKAGTTPAQMAENAQTAAAAPTVEAQAPPAAPEAPKAPATGKPRK